MVDYSLIYKISAKIENATEGFKRVHTAFETLAAKSKIAGRTLAKTLTLQKMAWLGALALIGREVKNLLLQSSILQLFIGTWKSLLGTLIDIILIPFIPLLMKLTEWMVKFITKLKDSPIWIKASEAAFRLITEVLPVVIALVFTLMSTFGKIGGIKFLIKILTFLADVVKKVILALPGLLETGEAILATLGGKISTIIDKVVTGFGTLITAFGGDPAAKAKAKADIMSFVGEIFGDTLTFVINQKTKIVNKVIEVVQWIIDAMPDHITGIVNAVTSLISNTLGPISTWIGSHLPEIGKKIIGGIIQGIKTISIWKLVNPIKDKITAALGLVFHITPKIQAIGTKFGEILNKSLAKVTVKLPTMDTAQMLKGWEGATGELTMNAKPSRSAAIDRRIYNMPITVQLTAEMKEEGKSMDEIATEVADLLEVKMRQVL